MEGVRMRRSNRVRHNAGKSSMLSSSIFNTLALTSALIKSWTALGGSLVVGITSGGPPVIIYGWIAVSVFSMAVAYSFAEICSAYPVAGGQYSWVAQLAHPNYTIERWHTCLVAYLVLILAAANNIWGRSLLNKLGRIMIIFNLISFVLVIVVLLARNDHKQSTAFVFKDFQNFSGFGIAYASLLGLLQSAFGMTGYDAAAHMTEEVKDARKDAP
ncbi:hypothetical protein MMC14_008517 [Varicellaria rhodocarpa]|nr:hypothetical protein [Varicellaria rhodocarpa]